METLFMIENICIDFIERKFDIEEFQSRINTLVVEDSLKNSLGKVLSDADNRLEEILFCSLETNFYSYGVAVAKNLLEKMKSFS